MEKLDKYAAVDAMLEAVTRDTDDPVTAEELKAIRENNPKLNEAAKLFSALIREEFNRSSIAKHAADALAVGELETLQNWMNEFSAEFVRLNDSVTRMGLLHFELSKIKERISNLEVLLKKEG